MLQITQLQPPQETVKLLLAILVYVVHIQKKVVVAFQAVADVGNIDKKFSYHSFFNPIYLIVISK